MKKMISVLLVSLLLAVRFFSAAFAEGFELPEEAPHDAQVGWGVFSLPADLKPQSAEPSDRSGRTDNPPAPSSGHLTQPDTIRNDYPCASDRSPGEIEQEIIERCGENSPLPLISMVPIPYIPAGEIDTNFNQ